MSAKKKNGGPKKRSQKPSRSLLQQGKDWFQDRHPIFRFLAGFVICMGVFYLFYNSSFYQNQLSGPLLNFQARLSNAFLHLLGHDTTVTGTTLASSEFSVNIKSGCDGLEATAILVSGILIFPVAMRLKVPGLLIGIAALFVLNLLRIAGLYLTGLYFSERVFQIMHIQGGFIIFTMISVLLWFIWMNWSTKKMQETAAS